MSSFYLRNHIQNLHQQINHSVDKIKQHSSYSQSSQSREEDTYLEHYRVEGQFYQLLSGDVNWSLQNQKDGMKNNFQYVSQSYTYAKDILKEPSVLIDYMFPNNKDFDFKV